MNVSRTEKPSLGWIALAGLLIFIELTCVYEAFVADIGGFERIFAVFAGLSILCFAALLYAVSVIFYGWD